MELVFINVLLNAIQAVAKKEGTITVKAKQDDKFNIIEFENTDSKIPEKMLSEIFEPLVTTKEKGTGLGLSSCKNIIEQHKGKITAKNDPTTFTIKIPKDLKAD